MTTQDVNFIWAITSTILVLVSFYGGYLSSRDTPRT